MRLLLALLMLAVSVLPGHAISRYQSTKLTCDAIKERIADEGAVILRYPGRSNPSITVYDRYVANGRFCASHEVAQRQSVPAADTKSCRVWRCVPAPDRCERPGAFCRTWKMPRHK